MLFHKACAFGCILFAMREMHQTRSLQGVPRLHEVLGTLLSDADKRLGSRALRSFLSYEMVAGTWCVVRYSPGQSALIGNPTLLGLKGMWLWISSSGLSCWCSAGNEKWLMTPRKNHPTAGFLSGDLSLGSHSISHSLPIAPAS